jgi:hypothetical protein
MGTTRQSFVGLLVIALSACDDAPTQTTAPAVQPDVVAPERLAELARRVEAAEAIRNVKRLQWAYGHYSELGLWHDFADLFADTGVGHYVQGDLDREGIRKLFVEQVGQGQLGLADGRIYPHISFSPVVTLDADGEHAHARFRILAMLGGYGGNATWFHGLYENAYVKERGVWKVNELSNTAQITGNFTEGLTTSDGPALAFHFTPEQVGSIPLAPGAAVDSLASLQRRAERLADEAAITNLQHQYGFYFDNHDWDALTELFAEDGSFETGQRGVYVGKAVIRSALEQFGALNAGDVDEHYLFQTYVSIAPDGRTAAARVDQLGIQSKQGGTAEWTQGIYENRFVKEAGEWRIYSVHYYPRLITDYSKGWAADAQATPGVSTAYPPSAPPTETYEVYPTFYLPAFHFSHPVTGRAPQYPDGSPASAKSPGFAVPSQASNATVSALGADAVEALVQQSLARDAVENLLNAYAYYEDGCRSTEAQALFMAGTDLPFLCIDGRQPGEQSLQHALQPVISIAPDGQSATVTSKLWVVAATSGSGPWDDYYGGGLLKAEAVVENGQWKLRSVVTEPRWSGQALREQPIGQ